MANAGDRIETPFSETIVFRQTSEETAGALLEMEAFFRPRQTKPPEHYHPQQEERFEVMSGELWVRMGGQERTYRARESFIVPIGTSHTMTGTSEGESRVIWQVRPALKTEHLFETVWGLSKDGKTNKRGVPGDPFQLAVLLAEYGDEFRIAGPLGALQKLIALTLGPIGRLLGYRGRYERYGGPADD